VAKSFGEPCFRTSPTFYTSFCRRISQGSHACRSRHANGPHPAGTITARWSEGRASGEGVTVVTERSNVRPFLNGRVRRRDQQMKPADRALGGNHDVSGQDVRGGGGYDVPCEIMCSRNRLRSVRIFHRRRVRRDQDHSFGPRGADIRAVDTRQEKMAQPQFPNRRCHRARKAPRRNRAKPAEMDNKKEEEIDRCFRGAMLNPCPKRHQRDGLLAAQVPSPTPSTCGLTTLMGAPAA
jgi:hypothetical protein